MINAGEYISWKDGVDREELGEALLYTVETPHYAVCTQDGENVSGWCPVIRS